jgi:type IV pilus assembly protein PilF
MKASTRVVLHRAVLRESLCAIAFASLLLTLGCTTSSPSERFEPQADTQPKPADKVSRAKVHLDLASYYFSRGQGTTALDEIKQAISADPDVPGGYNLRGLILASLDQPAAAETSFRKALQVNPKDGDAMNNYGWFLCQQRRYSEADAQFVAALAQPAYRDTVRTLLAEGVCQARNMKSEDAERTLMRAYEIDPANPTTAFNLSEVLYRRGDYERALFYINRVNDHDELISAQTLWLAAKIETRLGHSLQVQILGSKLRNRYPQAPETLLFERGRFDG